MVCSMRAVDTCVFYRRRVAWLRSSRITCTETTRKFYGYHMHDHLGLVRAVAYMVCDI